MGVEKNKKAKYSIFSFRKTVNFFTTKIMCRSYCSQGRNRGAKRRIKKSEKSDSIGQKLYFERDTLTSSGAIVI